MTVRGGVELQRRFAAIGDTSSLMRTLGERTRLNAFRNTRKFRKTGHTGSTIKLERSDGDSARVSVRGAGPHLEFGTKPHIIRARQARALRFAVTSGGQRLTGSPRRGAAIAFARSVRHPGTRAQPFMRPAAEKAVRDSGLQHIRITWDSAA